MNYTNPYQYLSGKLNSTDLINAGFEEKLYDRGDVKLNYIVAPKNGPALLLIPAQIGTWESYHKVLIPLSKHFHLYVLEIRGHGKSSWTPGEYSWKTVGEDVQSFIENVICEKVIVGGNSSGGVVALWCAANMPARIAGIVMEDAPIFSAEMPRFKDRDRFVYNGLKHLVETIGDMNHRNLADYFSGLEMPISEKRVKKVPDMFIKWMRRHIEKFEREHPNQPIELTLPEHLKILIKSLSMFDTDFARAFVDGRFYEGINHADALRATKCPILLLHGDWKRYEKYGLVGAMDDADAKRIMELAPQTVYKKIAANHVIHTFKPKEYIEALLEFKKSLR